MNKSKSMIVGAAVVAAALGGTITVFADSSSANAATGTTTASQQWQGKQAADGRHKHGSFARYAEVAKILGMNPKALKAELQSGKSLVDIAKEKNITEDQLIGKLKDHYQTNLDKAVKAGKLTTNEAEQKLSQFDARAKKFVEHKGLPTMHRRLAMVNLKDVCDILGVTPAQLKAELKSGKSIADVAASKNISEDTLLLNMKSRLQQRLDTAVSNKKITSDKAQTILKNFDAHAKTFVERKGVFVHKQQTANGNGTGSK